MKVGRGWAYWRFWTRIKESTMFSWDGSAVEVMVLVG